MTYAIIQNNGDVYDIIPCISSAVVSTTIEEGIKEGWLKMNTFVPVFPDGIDEWSVLKGDFINVGFTVSTSIKENNE